MSKVDETAVEAFLDAYRGAFEELDVDAILVLSEIESETPRVRYGRVRAIARG